MAAIDYLSKIRDLKKPEYTSQYGGIIGDIMGKIVNRQPFSYDFNADPIFQQYKDYYTKAGNEAAMNAVANASALTGGYGNSYAVTAGAQANQQALSGLNNIIPQLYNSAQKKYDSDTNALLTQYDMYNQAENDAYGKYRDQISDFDTERNYLTGRYNSELDQENYLAEQAEQRRLADLAQANWEAEQAEARRLNDQAQANWEAEFAENKRLADLEQQNYLSEKEEARRLADQEYQLQLAKLNAKSSGSSSNSSSKSKKDKEEEPAKVTTPNYADAEALDKLMADEVNYAKQAARNKAQNQKTATTAQTNSPDYRDYVLTQKAINTYNGTKDINQVEKMLEEQIKKGTISENEALSVLDKIIKNIH